MNKPNTSSSNLNEATIIEVLKTIFDPEIPVNIYDLGLIYAIIIDNSNVTITMTLTNPNCPMADSLLNEVWNKLSTMKEVGRVKVDLVFEPKWTPDKMTEEAKLELGYL